MSTADPEEDSLVGQWVRPLTEPHHQGVCVAVKPHTLSIKYSLSDNSVTAFKREVVPVHENELTGEQRLLLLRIRRQLQLD